MNMWWWIWSTARAALVSSKQRGHFASINAPSSVLQIIALCFCNESVTSLEALYSATVEAFVCRMHNPCINMPHTTDPCVRPCDLSGGQRHLYSCGWDWGIAGDLIGALSLHEGLPQLLSVVPPAHLLYHFTAVIYIIQTTGECLWALNHLLAFIS